MFTQQKESQHKNEIKRVTGPYRRLLIIQS